MEHNAEKKRCPTCGRLPHGPPRAKIWDDADAIVETYKRGYTAPKIAIARGCSTSTVYHILHERGITVRARGRPRGYRMPNRKLPPDEQLLYLLRNNTQSAIAKHYGVSRQWVNRAVKNLREKQEVQP